MSPRRTRNPTARDWSGTVARVDNHFDVGVTILLEVLAQLADVHITVRARTPSRYPQTSSNRVFTRHQLTRVPGQDCEQGKIVRGEFHRSTIELSRLTFEVDCQVRVAVAARVS
jgi:hypothetical protein